MTVNQQKLDEQHGRLFGEISAGYGGVMVALGDKLGLYKAMAAAGPLSSHEVARRSGCAERYVRARAGFVCPARTSEFGTFSPFGVVTDYFRF